MVAHGHNLHDNAMQPKKKKKKLKNMIPRTKSNLTLGRIFRCGGSDSNAFSSPHSLLYNQKCVLFFLTQVQSRPHPYLQLLGQTSCKTTTFVNKENFWKRIGCGKRTHKQASVDDGSGLRLPHNGVQCTRANINLSPRNHLPPLFAPADTLRSVTLCCQNCNSRYSRFTKWIDRYFPRVFK